MTVVGLDHIQIAMPRGHEDEARRFYGDILGLTEVPKPADLASRGGVWFQSGSLNLHVGVEDDFRPARKAHPALLVRDIRELAARFEAHGYTPQRDESVDGCDRMYVHDPFGNRIELMERVVRHADVQRGEPAQSRGPAYRICTPRLVLRCWQPDDAPLLTAAVEASLEHLRPWMPWAVNEPEPVDQKVQRLRRFRANFDLGRDFIYGVWNGAETDVLGGTGLHTRVGPDAREIGYWIHAGHTRQGYATEAVAALTKIGFQVDGIERMEIHCDPRNEASTAIPRKLGYRHDATLRRRANSPDGSVSDIMIWSLFRDEFPDTPAADATVTAFDGMGRQLL
jgi:RimJ/RimL family protein N-acetyltransferase/catechol 2,3-dioxygenase-like lactoylglutathione lyase family enzyme